MIKKTHRKMCAILEKIKWLSILILLFISFLINYYLYTTKFFIRLCIFIFLGIFSIKIFLCTKQGKYIFSHIKSLQREIEKIAFPKYKDTLYTTLIVMVITIIMSLILWALDNIILRLITMIIGLRF
jgi:preprotein translocase subunit SecE